MRQKLARCWQVSTVLRLTVLGLFSALLLSLLLGAFWPQMSAQATMAGGTTPVDLPWSFNEAGAGKKLTVTLQHHWGSPARWQIIPDDSLREIVVNNQAVSLAGIRPEALSDYNNGFLIDLAPYMQRGTNTLVFTVDNLGGGPGGLSLRPLFGPWRWALVGASFLPLLIGLGGVFRLRPAQTFVIALSLILLCAYWAATPWQLRTHDAVGWDGHIGYVQFVARELALPLPSAGWTYYHPPVYYILGAAVWRWASLAGLPGPESLQALSLALWLVFVTSAAGTLRVALRHRPGIALLATLLLAFWPAGIIHSIRLGNDAAFYAASGIASWYTILWWKTRSRNHLLCMAASIVVALMCKSNATVFVAVCGLLVLLHALRRRNRQAIVALLLYSAITLTGVAASFAVRVYYFLKGDIPSWLIANGNSLNDGLIVPTTLKSFLPLDIPTYLVTPFISAWNDSTGRANFWNYLLKTGLFGQTEFDGPVQQMTALVLGALMLALIIAALAYRSRKLTLQAFWRHLPWSIFAFVWIAALIVLRIDLPYSCSNDARYILPIMIPVLIWWGLANQFARALMVCMLPFSAVFFLTL